MARTQLSRLTRRLEPYVDRITGHPWIRRYAPRLADPDLWHLNRRSSARAVAVGLFSGLVPGPLQVLGAVGLSILFRANFPLAAITTLYTNPLTIVPLYMLAFQVGSVFLPGEQHLVPPPAFALSASYVDQLIAWMSDLGKPLAIGLPLLSLALALLGYVAVRVSWRWQVVRQWRRRARSRSGVAA